MKKGERAEAKANGNVRYFTGRPCPQGHVAERFTTSGRCAECTNLLRKRNPEKDKAWREKYQRDYAELLSQKAKEWRKANPAKVKEVARQRANAVKQWHQEHKPRVREISRNYKRSDKGKEASRREAAARRERMSSQVPRWADWVEIEQFYTEARHLTEATGVLHVVDHIVPILGEDVSGLHVHNNLQIMTSVENSRKGNRYTHDI